MRPTRDGHHGRLDRQRTAAGREEGVLGSDAVVQATRGQDIGSERLIAEDLTCALVDILSLTVARGREAVAAPLVIVGQAVENRCVVLGHPGVLPTYALDGTGHVARLKLGRNEKGGASQLQKDCWRFQTAERVRWRIHSSFAGMDRTVRGIACVWQRYRPRIRLRGSHSSRGHEPRGPRQAPQSSTRQAR